MLHEVIRVDFEVFQVRGSFELPWFPRVSGIFGIKLKIRRNSVKLRRCLAFQCKARRAASG